MQELHYERLDARMQPIAGSADVLEADLVLLAMGFAGPAETDVVKPDLDSKMGFPRISA